MQSAIEEQNLNIYCQSNSLLFQFILADFLKTFSHIQEVERIYDQMEATLIKRRLHGGVEHYLTELLSILPSLTGSQSVIASEISFPWTAEKGSLNKLRHYCYLFVHRSKSEDKDIANMNVCVSKAFHSALQCREVILSLQQESLENTSVPSYVTLYQLLDRLIDNMRRVSRLILRILIQYRTDENVLYFLLRHREDFDRLYKTQFVIKILKKMYPRGIKEAGELLVEKYSRRGFDSIIPAINHQIEEMHAYAAARM